MALCRESELRGRLRLPPLLMLLAFFQQSKKCIFNPTPQKFGTLFVNTTAPTGKIGMGFSAFLLLGVFAVSGFWSLQKKAGMKKKKPKFKTKQQERSKTTRCKQENHLVLFQKRESRQQHRHKAIQLHTSKNKQEHKHKVYVCMYLCMYIVGLVGGPDIDNL